MKFRLPLIIPIIFLSGCDINHIKKDIVNKNTPSPKKNMLIGSKKIKSQHVAMSTTRNYAKMAIITRNPINDSRKIKYHAAQWAKKKPVKSSYPQRKPKTPIKTTLKTSRYPVADNYIPEQSINNFTIYFGFDKSTILPVYNTVLQAIANSLTDNPDSMATVKAYTDSIGKTDYNQKLSERRAITIKKELINYGIASYKIHAFAYGESSKFDNYTTYGRAKNRRAEIQISDTPIEENYSDLGIKKIAEVKVATTKKTRGLKFKKNIAHKNTNKVKITKKKTDSKKKHQKETAKKKVTQREKDQKSMQEGWNKINKIKKNESSNEIPKKKTDSKEKQQKETAKKKVTQREKDQKSMKEGWNKINKIKKNESSNEISKKKTDSKKKQQKEIAKKKETQREKDEKNMLEGWNKINKIKKNESSNEIPKKKTDSKEKQQKETAKKKVTLKKETQREKDEKNMREVLNKIKKNKLSRLKKQSKRLPKNKISKKELDHIKKQSKRLSKQKPKMSKNIMNLINDFNKKTRKSTESKKRK